MEDKHVLTIQSHVVHGYVGNKSATFPLQLRGWDVDALNAVQFSNHTGYGSVRGYRLDEDQILDIYAGIEAQSFEYDALLTGYLPSASAVQAVHQIGVNLRAKNPDSVWVLDPVMGDHGALYVKEDVIPAYKKILATPNLVTIVTPNYFEVELITGIKVVTKEDVQRALKELHTKFAIPHVVISSLPHPTNPHQLLTVGSSAKITETGVEVGEPFAIVQEKLDAYFTGTGDLFAALLMDNYIRLGRKELAKATASTISTLRKVLVKTWEYSKLHHSQKVEKGSPLMRYRELRLIQNAGLLQETSADDVECVPYV